MIKDISSFISIDKRSPVPIYHQLSEGLRNLIVSGEYSQNDRLPSENELAEMFGIVPMTVRQAMTQLVLEGLIYRERGRGTFVSAHALEHPLDYLVSFTEDMRSRNLTPGSRILYFNREVPPREIEEKLSIPTDETVLHIKRVRLANDNPVGYHDCYIRGVDLTIEDFERNDSLYALLGEKEVFIAGGNDVLEAREADNELSELLNVHKGAALLHVTRTSYDSTGRPVEVVMAAYRSDLYRYSIHLKTKDTRR